MNSPPPPILRVCTLLLRLVVLLAAPGGTAAWAAQPPAADAFLYVFFRDPGDAGIFFAVSEDGYRWTTVAGDQPWLLPPTPGARTRDPFIARDPNGGGFHLVWTAGGRIGYRHSADLVVWSEPRLIAPFPPDIPVENVGAPEVVWDAARVEWLVLWSSTIRGRFPETAGQVDRNRNHRIFAAATRDFRAFSEPWLFYDPGFPVIDATVADVGGRWAMVVKDERDRPLRKRLQLAFGPSPRGPWGQLSAPLTPAWTEGPSLLHVSDGWLLYHDFYKGAGTGMRALHTTDLVDFDDATARLAMPLRSKHGGFIPISRSELTRLRAGGQPDSPPPTGPP